MRFSPGSLWKLEARQENQYLRLRKKNQQTLQRPSAKNHMYCLICILYRVLQEILIWEYMRWIHEMSDFWGRCHREEPRL